MTEKQKDFVHMYLKHRDKIIAHNIVYGDTGNYDAAESAANRLLRIPEIADTIQSIQDNIRHEVEEEFKAKYREELLSIYDKRMLLKKIATGEMYVEQKYKGKNCTQCSQYISPTINQMLAAIREDNKLAGHHPHKVNGKWVIPALQTEQHEKPSENTLDSISPRPNARLNDAVGQGSSGRALGVGGKQLPQENTPEKDLSEPCNGTENKGQQIDFMQDRETSPLQGPARMTRSDGDLGVHSRNANPPENDNKREHLQEPTFDNQSLVEEQTTHDTALSRHSISEGGSINPSANIISQEAMKELLYLPKPKLSYMKNNP